MFVTIGKAITKIIILPANKILSATLLLPASLHTFAPNSVKYPTPIIFNTVLNSPAFIPVFWTRLEKVSIISKI